MVDSMSFEDPFQRRMTIQQNLMNLSQYYLSLKDQMTVVHEEKDRNLLIR